MATDPNLKEPITPAGLARYLGVTLRTVQRWMADKRIKPTFVTYGRHARFSPESAKAIKKKMALGTIHSEVVAAEAPDYD